MLPRDVYRGGGGGGGVGGGGGGGGQSGTVGQRIVHNTHLNLV